ncbi:unnamed protein product [Aphanomyces euteiches]|nr:hypothetical protein Ae201684P_010114 [Aphanomyces euteiches]
MATAQRGTRTVHFVLVDEGRKPYKGTHQWDVKIPENADHVDILRAVHAESSNVMVGIHPSQLTLYANEKACRSRQKPLNELLNDNDGEEQFTKYGKRKKDPLCIVVPSPIESKRQRTDPKHREFSVKDITFDEVARGSFIKISGVDISRPSRDKKKEMWMYCRKDTLRLIKALDDVNALANTDGSDESHRGVWIQGTPGVGKSITTWFWACKQAASGKSVLWIHVDITSGIRLVRLTQDNTWKLEFHDKSDIPQYIARAIDDIVVIDGVTKEDYHFEIRTRRLRHRLFQKTIFHINCINVNQA